MTPAPGAPPAPIPPAGPAGPAVHLYWRPGCVFCMMLRRGLRKAGVDTIMHNIWDDPAAAATVRLHANGSETVPTIVIDGAAMVNPRANQVVDHLQRLARVRRDGDRTAASADGQPRG